MTVFKKVSLWVDENIADELTRKQVAEICFRDSYKRFKTFDNCYLADPLHNNNDPNVQQILTAGGQISKGKSCSIEHFYHLLNNLNYNMTDISPTLKNLLANTDSIFNSVNGIKHIGVFNSAIGIINLSADIAGFAVIEHKLSEMNTILKDADEKLDKLLRNESNKQYENYDKLLMKSMQWNDRIKDNDVININELDDYLIELKGFLSYLQRSVRNHAVISDELLEMLTYLTKFYSMLLCWYITERFFKKGDLPSYYENYISIFRRMTDNEFLDRLMEYLFLSCRLSNREAITDINVIKAMAAECMSEITDRVTLLKALKSKEKFQSYNELLKNLTMDEAEEAGNMIAEQLGKSPAECISVLQGAVSQY